MIILNSVADSINTISLCLNSISTKSHSRIKHLIVPARNKDCPYMYNVLLNCIARTDRMPILRDLYRKVLYILIYSTAYDNFCELNREY